MAGRGGVRAASKFAVIGIANSSFRSFPGVVSGEHPITTAARKATRPVSTIVSSSSDDVKIDALVAGSTSSQDGKVIDPLAQNSYWELDKEFAGGQDELFVDHGEHMPRLVFGSAPTLQEAKEATGELKDAVEKAYLSSKSVESRSSFKSVQEPAMLLLPKSDYSNKACVSCSSTIKEPIPNSALQAFKFLSESPVAQTVVASIASDQNVWNAVLKNEALTEFLRSQKTSSSVESTVKEYAAFADFDPTSPRSGVSESCDSGSGSGSFSGSGFIDYFNDVKECIEQSVVEMMSSLSGFFRSLFGGSSDAVGANGSGGVTFVDKFMGASFMGLAIMVIMVVVLKRN